MKVTETKIPGVLIIDQMYLEIIEGILQRRIQSLNMKN